MKRKPYGEIKPIAGEYIHLGKVMGLFHETFVNI